MISRTWKSERDRIVGFKYLWLKTVTGFDSSVHCARCLVGKYSSEFRPKMVVNSAVGQKYKEGTVLYFCGVSTPYIWANNLHIAGVVTEGSKFQTFAYNGDYLFINNFERFEFNDRLAKSQFPKLSKEYLTCRNF
jgi:hypothetical protein